MESNYANWIASFDERNVAMIPVKIISCFEIRIFILHLVGVRILLFEVGKLHERLVDVLLKIKISHRIVL